MITEVTMYSVVCDVCDITYIDDHRGYSAMGDPDTIAEWAIDSGWYIEGSEGAQKCYCPECRYADHLIIKPPVDKEGL